MNYSRKFLKCLIVAYLPWCTWSSTAWNNGDTILHLLLAPCKWSTWTSRPGSKLEAIFQYLVYEIQYIVSIVLFQKVHYYKIKIIWKVFCQKKLLFTQKFMCKNTFHSEFSNFLILPPLALLLTFACCWWHEFKNKNRKSLK